MQSSVFELEEFRQDSSAAEEAAEEGPIYLAQDGRAVFVLLKYEDYRAILQIARLPNLRHDEVMVSFAERIEMEL